MIIIFFSLTAWALWYKYGRRHKKRHTTTAYAAPVLSPAEVDRRRKAQETAQRSAERERIKAEKERAAREQAKQDYSFYSARLKTLLAMETDAAKSYYNAVETVEHDAQQNEYSYVIGEKTVQKHIAERDRLQSRLLKIQTQIHGTEKQLAKAKSILTA